MRSCGARRLPEIPAAYALYHPEDGVTAWVLAMPGGLALVVPLDADGEECETGLIHTSLDQVVSFCAPWEGADLMQVTA